MSSLVITVKSNRADLSRYLRPSDERKEGLQSLSQLFNAAAGGLETASVDVQSSASDPVAASGTLTLVSAIATDAITIGAVTLTASSTPADEDEWEIDGASDTLDAASLAAAINAHSVLSLVVSASSDANEVTVTALQKGLVGNQIPLSSADATITASATFLAGGTGGAASAAKTYSAGL